MIRIFSVKRLAEANRKMLSMPTFLELPVCRLNLQRPSFTLHVSHIGKLLDAPGATSVSSRLQSTTPITKLVKSTRTVKKTKKKYTELVQVSKNSSTEIKQKVKNLKAKQLAQFISLGDNNSLMVANNSKRKVKSLDDKSGEAYSTEVPVIMVKDDSVNPHSLIGNDNIVKSYEDFRYVGHTDTAPEFSELVDSAKLLQCNNLLLEEEIQKLDEEDSIITLDAVDQISVGLDMPMKSKNIKIGKYRLDKDEIMAMERKAKEKSFLSHLHSYLGITVENGLVNKAYSTLLQYRYRSKTYPNSVHITDISLYNIIMNGYAEKGNVIKIKEVLKVLQEDQINLNSYSYALILDCVARSQRPKDQTKFVNEIISKAEEQQISLNNIMNKSKFVKNQRESVLEAIRLVQPAFVPEYVAPILTYNNTLLNNLNTSVRPIAFTKTSDAQALLDRPNNTMTKDTLLNYAKEQLDNELKGFVTIQSVEKFSDTDPEKVEFHKKKLNEMEEMWKIDIIKAFERDLNSLRQQTQSKHNRSINLLPYLKALDVNEYVNILLREVRKLAEGSETFSPTVGQLYRELGQRVQTRFQVINKANNGILSKLGDVYNKYTEDLVDANRIDNSRQSWQRIVHENRSIGPSIDYNDKTWPTPIIISVGRFLYHILMHDVRIDVNATRMNAKSKNFLPAFYALFRNHGRLVKEEIKPHPVLARLYRGAQQQTLTFDTNMVPMLCPPQPWSSPKTGGYLLMKSELIRLPQQAFLQWERIGSLPENQMYPVLDSINQLSTIPWKVNESLLDIMLEVFNSGGSEKLDVPVHPKFLEPPTDLDDDLQNLSGTEKFLKFKQKLGHRRKQAEAYSLWCDALYRLSLANHLRKRVFWLPHNIDFRGRVYPIPPHLNHLGSDLARSLLVFHEPKELGQNGLDWLKIHLINLTGLKKRESIKHRLSFANKILDDILDSADNPLDGKMWWTQSDEPWQTLACCIEIANAVRSPNPKKFLSSFPIHQDGSCNGLQHYAALGRDDAGAKSVNLAPSNKPQDVYSSIATLVEGFRKRDAENGIEVAQVLNGFVQRKVIKQTVMTTVYGVTRYGARLQIARQLKDIESFPKEWVWPGSTYLTTKTFESLREMFTSTKEIQDWFTDCAKYISSICGQNVEWVTPLGLPVVQPYTRFDKHPLPKSNKFSTSMVMDQFEKPNVMKQKNAFPPNFIHSLDSSHMMLTSLNCERSGLTFVSVHDCYWTHPCTVVEMNKICREQFVALHSQPILENLSDFLIDRFNPKDTTIKCKVKDFDVRKLNRVLSGLPEKGTFDLMNVLKSVYFFS